MKNDMKNYDLDNVIDVVNSGITRIERKNTAMMEQLAKDKDELLGKIDRLQSGSLRAGLIDDDGDDVVKQVEEMVETLGINLGELNNSGESFDLTVNAALAGAGFLRVDKEE